jgi:hypothetical protein
MAIDLKNLTPKQAKWVRRHERLHSVAFGRYNRRKQFESEMMKYITNEKIREGNNGGE